MSSNRRHFLGQMSTLAGAAYVSAAFTPAPRRLPISCNQYTWYTFYGRDDKDWMADPDACLSEYVQSGLTAYEPSLGSAEDARKLKPLLEKYRLAMPSVYVNSSLHEANEAKDSIDNVAAIADVIREMGCKIVVTNPNPIRWGGPENKNDQQLEEQARNLNRLGAVLRSKGLILAYHSHDPEFRLGAREFHHMLAGTDPKNVSFCLDTHWVFRGAGNSQVALFDVVRLYGKRIVELHLRQSKDGIWTEAFGPGDIDYPRLAGMLRQMNIRPHIVLEQCIEEKSPRTLTTLEAHQRDLQYAREVFGKW